MSGVAADLGRVSTVWEAFHAEVPLRAIRTDADYETMVALMNQLLDAIGDDEHHPLSELLGVVGDLVSGYDAEHFAVPKGEPREVLRFLMEQKGLKQADLGDILPQPNLSAILNGRRAISRAVARQLAERFNVAIDVFV